MARGLERSGDTVVRLALADLYVRTVEVTADLLAPRAAADGGPPCIFAWTEHTIGATGYHLADGTDRMQRNVTAERAPGLLPDPRVDNDTHWS